MEDPPTLPPPPMMYPQQSHPAAVIQQQQNQQPGRGSDVGYGGLAAFMDMDNDTMLFRRFGALSVRALLYMQDEIIELERHIKNIENFQIQKSQDLGDRDEDPPEKKEAMGKLKQLLKEYADAIESFSVMRKHKLASHTQRHNLSNWMTINHPLTDEEQAFVKEDDLIAILARETSLLDRFVARQPWLTKLFFSNKKKAFPPEVAHERRISYFNDRSVERAVKWVVVVLSLIFLILPMLILQLVLQDKSAAAQAGFTAAFIAIFAFFMSAFTLARPAEILAATAGYSAVLVVFMNQSQPYFGNSSQAQNPR